MYFIVAISCHVTRNFFVPNLSRQKTVFILPSSSCRAASSMLWLCLSSTRPAASPQWIVFDPGMYSRINVQVLVFVSQAKTNTADPPVLTPTRSKATTCPFLILTLRCVIVLHPLYAIVSSMILNDEDGDGDDGDEDEAMFEL